VSGLTKGRIVGVESATKALVKLALSGLGCPSLPDMFHLLYALSKSIGSAIARQQVQLQNNTKAYKRNSKRSHLLPPSLRCQPKSQYYKPNRTNWKSTVKTISKIYTPCPKLFTLTSTPNLNLGSSYPLCSPFWLMWSGWVNMLTRAAAAIDVWQRQIPQGQFMPGGSGYSKLSVPKPKTRIHNIGCSQFSLGLLASTNRKDTARTQTGLPPSHSTSARSFSGT